MSSGTSRSNLQERLHHRLSASDPLEFIFYSGDPRLEVSNLLREGDDGVVDARRNKLAATCRIEPQTCRRIKDGRPA